MPHGLLGDVDDIVALADAHVLLSRMLDRVQGLGFRVWGPD